MVDGDKAVEVKFKLEYQDKYFDKCWRVLGHQTEYFKDYPNFFWGFGFYKLSKEAKDISILDFSNLESLVKKREIYIVKSDWVNNFPRYHESGKTYLSEWDHHVLFPKMKDEFPEVVHSEEVHGGKVFFTEGINRGLFQINKGIFSLNLNDFEDSSCPF